MKNNMEDIDKLIRESLNEEEAKFYDDLNEQGVIGMLKGLFVGKNWWLILIMNIMILIFAALFVYCIVSFFTTSETNELIKWGFGSLVFLFGMSFLKVFAWLQMDKNALLREIKRLELQISSLSGKISS